MGEILSAASLLVAIIGILYGQWYKEIEKAIDLPIPDQPADRKKPYKEARGVLLGKSIPLTISSLTVTLIFLPDAIRIVFNTFTQITKSGIRYIELYDSVATAFTFVEVVSIALFIHLASIARSLSKHTKDLNPK